MGGDFQFRDGNVMSLHETNRIGTHGALGLADPVWDASASVGQVVMHSLAMAQSRLAQNRQHRREDLRHTGRAG